MSARPSGVGPACRLQIHVNGVRGVNLRDEAMIRVLLLTVMVVMPGGLTLLLAYVLARTIAEQMRHEQGPGGRRFARAVATVRMRDVWAHTRQTFLHAHL